MMTEVSKDEHTAKLMKRANEENKDSAEVVQAAKRIKAEGEITEDEKKYPKKKVVLLLAYSGKGYYGMQVRTVVGLSLSVLCTSFSPILLNVTAVCVSEKSWNLSV